MADMVELAAESRSFVDNYSNRREPMDASTSLESMRQRSEDVAEKLKGDFIFTGTADECFIPATDNGVNYTVPVTVLRPPAEGSGSSCANIMVYFHGGGWTWGSRKTHMKLCEMISHHCRCVVLNVEYRLSPEHKFPACYVDAEAVVKWCLSRKSELAGTESALVGVAGDSAGGNIAASICHVVNGLNYQVLIYPSLTLSMRNSYPSAKKYGSGFLLTTELGNWFINNLLSKEEDAKNVLCSPIHRESFKELPPALFVVAECDPLADQSSDYQKKLEDSGVKTDMLILKGTVHGFVNKPGHFKEATEENINCIRDFLLKL